MRLMLVMVVFLSACVQQQAEIKEITIPGHGNQVYAFSNDIRAANKIYTNDEESIRNIFFQTGVLPIVFDGSSQEDNAFFRVVLINLGKIPVYLSYEGKIFRHVDYYFIDDKWYDQNGNETEKPRLESALWLRGPNTGANETSVRHENGIIYLQGTDYRNLTLAGDKLALVVFDYKPYSEPRKDSGHDFWVHI